MTSAERAADELQTAFGKITPGTWVADIGGNNFPELVIAEMSPAQAIEIATWIEERAASRRTEVPGQLQFSFATE